MDTKKSNKMQQSLNRRSFIRLMGAGTAALALPGLGCAGPKGGKKPNIIFVMADDLGYGDLGCFGQTMFATPHLDRMAAEGMWFTDFYAGSTVCAPSRSCLLTGTHTGHTRIRGNSSKVTGDRVPLLPEDLTVAEVLKQAGYATGVIGKWGLGESGTTGIPNRQGFDYWFGYLNQRRAHNYYPDYLWRNEEKVILEGNVVEANVAIRRAHYSHDLFTREALDFIDRNRDQPFFLYLAYTIPHANNQAGEEGMEVPSDEPYSDENWPQQQKNCAAMIHRLDRDMGQIFAKLKTLGLDEDTIVFFTSDNGPHSEGGNDPEFFNSNGPLRGIKRDLYEGGIRVPMIVHWPGHIKAGTTSSLPWAHWDFLPTAAAIAGVEVSAPVDGISVLPTLQGKAQKDREYLYWEFEERRGFNQAVRVGDWKGVRRNPDAPTELYSLREDLGESRNAAAGHPDTVARVEEIFTSARTESEHWPMPVM